MNTSPDNEWREFITYAVPLSLSATACVNMINDTLTPRARLAANQLNPRLSDQFSSSD